MALNKSGKTEIGTVLVWVLIVGVIAYVANFGGFQGTVNGWLGQTQLSSTQVQQQQQQAVGISDSSNCPTSGLTSLTINVQDALATTATSRYPEYFIFNGNQLIKEGTLTSTDSTVDVSCGKDYKLLLINTTAGNGNGLYSKIVDVKARIAEQTVNDEMIVTGTAKINKIFNEAEGASASAYHNMTLGASSTKNWGIQFNANHTARGFNQPIIMCQANTTEIQTISLTSFDDGTTPVAVTSLPKRISTSTGYQFYAWLYPGVLDPTKALVTGKGSLTSTATGPVAAATSYMECRIIDQQMWKTASYKTASSIEGGFKTGPENTETNADVGGTDSAVDYLYFVNANGI